LNHFQSNEESTSKEGISNLAEKSDRLVVRIKNEIKIIPTNQVLYFEAEDDYISIHTATGKYLKKMTMKSLEEALDPLKFTRVHRSFMLNLNEISKIEPYERDTYLVKLRTGAQVPVSKTGYSRLRQVLGL
jgi:two-component system LytT family response regulator